MPPPCGVTLSIYSMSSHTTFWHTVTLLTPFSTHVRSQSPLPPPPQKAEVTRTTSIWSFLIGLPTKALVSLPGIFILRAKAEQGGHGGPLIPESLLRPQSLILCFSPRSPVFSPSSSGLWLPLPGCGYLNHHLLPRHRCHFLKMPLGRV